MTSRGCGSRYVDRGLARATEAKMPRGLELCFTPDDLRAKKW